MFRGYDSGVVLREDIIERVMYLEAEITTLQNSIDKLKQKAAASEGRIQRLKRELGFTDSPEIGPEFPRSEVKEGFSGSPKPS